ncbi:MAG: hypothetical protein IKO91_07070 [Oscillospiraceae bacterium]|nr:hypothetical protein [Oscillospiraceae bacterium]
MTTAKRTLGMLAQFALLYAAAALISIFAPDVFLLRHCSTLFLLALSLALMLYFSEHIIARDTRKYLAAIAGLTVAWVTLRGAKYIAFEETELIARHIWYLYYVPALLIPLCSLLAALSVGRQEGNRRPWKVRSAVGVTLLLILLILSNDLHQLAFRFQPGFANWDAEYSRGPVNVAAYLWILALVVGVFYILFSRCRLSAGRKLVWLPMLPALFGAVYLTLYAMGRWPRIGGSLFGEFPETVCFTLAGVWMSLISIGLIPSNASYGKLFELSDLAAQIADRDYRVIYRNANAVSLSREQMASPSGVLLDRDTRVHRKAVAGGFVYWQDDIAELNRINEELRELGEQLAEETALLSLRNKLKEERAKIEAKTRVYDGIAEQVLPQSRRIAALCAEAEQAPEQYAANMKTVCLLAAYIKRYANLTLLAADQPALELRELFLALQESLRYVREAGIPADEAFSGEMRANSQRLIAAYALFETLLEASFPSLRGLQVRLDESVLKLSFEGAELALPEGTEGELTVEDRVSYVRLTLGEAGEPV